MVTLLLWAKVYRARRRAIRFRLMRLTWAALAFLLVTVPAAADPGAVTTWFDPATTRELMDARQEFDAAELQAIAAFEKPIGAERLAAVPEW
jgi:hypothetical protein